MKPNYQWIEDRFWTWIHYAALRLGRGELFDLIGFLSFLREQVLGPLALADAGHSPHGVRKIERYLPEFAASLRETIPEYNRESCYKATLATIELYKVIRARTVFDELVVNKDAESEAVTFLRQVAVRNYSAN